MSDLACANCTKRFETGNPASPLQCRALPPAPGPVFGVFPHVKRADFCHVYFQADPVAVEANRTAAEAQRKLDGLVAETQERAAIAAAAAAAAPVVDEAGARLTPPAGDLAADIADPKPLRRARRARATDEPQLL